MSRSIARTRHAVRSFHAAEQNNLTAGFRAEQVSLNLSLESSLRTMRARSRKLARDNDWVRKFLRMVQNHVVGPNGFALSVPCQRHDGSIDEADKAACESAFARWTKRGICDVRGRLSWVQLQRQAVLLCARDGEALVMRVRSRKANAWGYALQLIDPVLLDETYREDLANGARIRMGVETDALGRVAAYHLLADAENPWGSRRTRVDAGDIWHLFIQEEPDQVRGVPWMHTAIRHLHDLGGYEEAALIAARVGASKMGFYIPPADQVAGTGALAAQELDNKDQSHDLVQDAEPGTYEELPPGYDFKTFNPDYPHANFDAFIKAMLRGVASGLGVDYNTLANDLENVNYSSIRSGKLETQDEWMCLQGWFRESLHEPLWPEWLSHAMLSGQLALPAHKFDKFDVALWQGRRWPWVDPMKDMQARVLEIDHCLNSYSGVMREMGRDPEAIWRELEKDKQRLKELMPKPPPPAAPATTNSTPAPAGVATSGPDDGEDKPIDKESADA